LPAQAPHLVHSFLARRREYRLRSAAFFRSLGRAASTAAQGRQREVPAGAGSRHRTQQSSARRLA